MKRHKLYLLFAIIVGIMFAPFFAGCGEEIKITLKQPVNFGYEVNQETGEQTLIVEENPFASSYVFGVCSTKYENDLSKFLRYEFPARYTTTYQGQQVAVSHNFFDVTNIFKNAQTYYYYVQYKGQGKYLNSPISEVKSVNITYKLEAPYLSLTNTTLSWTSISNASTYSVYSIIDGKRESIATTQETSYDIAEYLSDKIAENLSSQIELLVYCNNTQNYLRSADSNIIVYNKHLQLAAPSNVRISNIEGEDYICWNPVKNCSSYTLKVNNIHTEILQADQLEKSGNAFKYGLRKYYDEYGLGDYTFSIKSNNSENFVESDYSSVVTATITKKLDTPQNIRCVVDASTVDIMWDAVENAQEYEVEYTDMFDDNKIKKLVLNSGSGIESSIIRNYITVTYQQLNIISGSQLQSDSYVIRIKAIGYNYYLTSDYSTGKTVVLKYQTLDAPVLQDDTENCLLYWDAISGAKNYRIIITFNSNIDTVNISNTSFDYSAYLIDMGTYEFSCIAVAYDEEYNSTYSNTITKQKTAQLSKPTINNISVDGDNLVIDFSGDPNAQNYSLYVNNNLITDTFTLSQNQVLIESVIGYAQNNKIYFALVANGHDLFTDSQQSNTFVFNTKLSTPSTQLSNNILSWSSVPNATSYSLFLDDEMQELNSTATSINLDNYVSQNRARQVSIMANNLYLDNSDCSSGKIYNHASKSLSGFTDKYFYYGQTYDYHITSEPELKDVVLYAYYNLLPTLTIYIDYEPSTTIYNKLVDSGHMKYITGTRNFNPSISNNSSTTGQTTITFNHKSLSGTPTYTASRPQSTSYMALVGDGSRTNNYKFFVETAIVSQDVYTTDGLLSAVQNSAKPHFMTSNSTAEQVYNVAKSVLIEICDDGMTDYEKALAIHDWICLNVSYDTYGLNTVDSNNYLGYFHFIESALLYNLGVCDAYAKTFALMCSLENVECIVIDGSTDKTDRDHTGHAWNKVHIDINGDEQKEWFTIDCTWDDATSGTEEYLKHQYFMIPDSYLTERYEDGDYPISNYNEYDSFYNFYKPNGLTILIDSQSDVTAVNTFVTRNPSKKIELLVKSNYVSSLYIGTYYQWSYTFDDSYKIIIKK